MSDRRRQGPLQAYRALVASGALSDDPAQAAVVERLQTLHKALKSYRLRKPGLFSRKPVRPRGAYIYGDVGRGKSMLMDLFFESAPVVQKRRVHFHAFMLETHEAINAWRKYDAREKAKHGRALGLKARGKDLDDPMPAVSARVAREAALLCFDEFQVTDVADAMILGRLFEGLFNEGMVVVATSNRAPQELYKNGLNRQLFVPFIDMIARELDVMGLHGATDYRLEHMKGVPVYYTPLGPEADRAMDAAWKALTSRDGGASCDLIVQGRTLHVPQAANGTARFGFEALCQRPLGAADYLALSHAFHSLLIDHIPRMGREMRNEARRFVTLVDALYERRIRLVCSAAVPPAELYAEGDGTFEFQRTVSRLIDMQSEEYVMSARRDEPEQG